MTKLHKTLEELYFILEYIDPDNLTNEKVEGLIKSLSNYHSFSKEDINFYSFDRMEAARLIKQSKIISRKASEIEKCLYTNELSFSRSEVVECFTFIKKIAINIELALSGPNHIYSKQYIATVMAIENNFSYYPSDKTINNMAKEYAQRYFEIHGITLKYDSLRKEYEGQFDSHHKFIGAKKDIDKEIIMIYLSERRLKKLHNYLYDSE